MDSHYENASEANQERNVGGVALDDRPIRKSEVIDPGDRMAVDNKVAQTEPVSRKKFVVQLRFDLIVEQGYLNESLPDVLARLQTAFQYNTGIEVLNISTTGQPLQEDK